jgi:hypothetical protein
LKVRHLNLTRTPFKFIKMKVKNREGEMKESVEAVKLLNKK